MQHPKSYRRWAKTLGLSLIFPLVGLSLGGCLVYTVAKTAGDVTASVVKTTGSVAVTAVKTGGSVAVTAVKIGTGVASAGVQTAVSLAKTGAVVVLDASSGSVWQMPWTKGMPMSLALSAAKAGVGSMSGKLVRKSGEITVPRDRWAKTYLEEGDVVVVEPAKK